MRNRSLKRQKAINYLLKYPSATAREVAKHAGLTPQTIYKLIKQRQTPVEVLVAPKETPATKGASLLREAADTFEQRSKVYGPAGYHWQEVAHVWSSISGTVITADMAVRMMLALKLMRLKETPNHHDSIVDIAGYAAVLAEAVAMDQ